MKAPRVTCRSLIVLVAIAAMGSWCCVMWQRSGMFAELANKYQFRKEIAEWNFNVAYSASPPDTAGIIRETRVVEQEDRMYRKYRRLVYFPWLSP